MAAPKYSKTRSSSQDSLDYVCLAPFQAAFQRLQEREGLTVGGGRAPDGRGHWSSHARRLGRKAVVRRGPRRSSPARCASTRAGRRNASDTRSPWISAERLSNGRSTWASEAMRDRVLLGWGC
jgi:hypothetical protein